MDLKGNIRCRHLYNDIYFDFLHQEMTEDISINNKHLLILVYAGELLIQEGKQQLSLKRGECVFVKSNTRVILIKKPENNETFQGIMLGLGHTFLKDFYHNSPCNRITLFMDFDKSIVKLTANVYTESLYVSLKPYLHQNIKPGIQLLALKSQEALYCLLETDVRLYTGIFNPIYLSDNPGKFYMN